MKTPFNTKFAGALLATVSLLAVAQAPAQAGGLLGDFINNVVPGAGTQLDEQHRRFKEAIPPYGQAEEGLSGVVQRTTQEAAVEAAGPTLAAMIQASRADAINAGVSPIPPAMRQALAVYFPADVLNGVRYRTGQGNELSLQANSFRFGDAAAITLGNVIVFSSGREANNARLWAHELGHVLQYNRWGILDFAKRYVRNHRAVEAEAEATAQAFDARYAEFNRASPYGGAQFGSYGNANQPQSTAGSAYGQRGEFARQPYGMRGQGYSGGSGRGGYSQRSYGQWGGQYNREPAPGWRRYTRRSNGYGGNGYNGYNQRRRF